MRQNMFQLEPNTTAHERRHLRLNFHAQENASQIFVLKFDWYTMAF